MKELFKFDLQDILSMIILGGGALYFWLAVRQNKIILFIDVFVVLVALAILVWLEAKNAHKKRKRRLENDNNRTKRQIKKGESFRGLADLSSRQEMATSYFG